MKVFVDTSALYTVLVQTEEAHAAVVGAWRQLLSDGHDLVTSNYVLVESTALLQRRFGMEAVHDLNRRIIPLLRVLWVGEETHRRALDRVLRADDRRLSLVDCVSFIQMEAEGIRTALALDEDFARHGFDVVPS